MQIQITLGYHFTLTSLAKRIKQLAVPSVDKGMESHVQAGAPMLESTWALPVRVEDEQTL